MLFAALACRNIAIMADYDRGYKLLFSNPEMVRDLLLGFVREEWVAKLDFDSLEKVSGSYVSDDLRERHDDVIWRVRFADKWLYLYILLEFQSKEDAHMAVRVLTYLGLLYQDLIRTKQFTPSGKLPPVLPIVLYNGENRWSAAEEVSELIENIPGNLARFSPKLRYLLIDEGAFEHSELKSLKNLVAVLFQLEKTPVNEVADELLYRFIEWVWDNKELQRAVAVFLTRVYFENKVDVSEIFLRAKNPSEVKTMLEKNREKWNRELVDKGRNEERQRLAKRLLTNGMSVSQVAELTELSEEEVQKLQDSVAN